MASFQKNFVVKNGLEVGLNGGSILVATSDGVGIGSTLPKSTLDVGGNAKIAGITTFGNNVIIDGNLTVSGTETIVKSSRLEVEDINIGIASATNKLTDIQLDGAGITIYGSEGDKTLTWDSSNSRLAFSTDVYAPRLNADTFIGNLEGNLNGLVTRVDQPNITSLGDLTGLSVSGISTLENKVEMRSDDGTPAKIDFYCEVNNLHYTRLQSAPHSQYSGIPVVTLPVASGNLIVGDTGSPISNDINTTGSIEASSFVGDGRGLTGIVEGIGIATSSGPVSYGITALKLEGSGISTSYIDSTSGIATIFVEGGSGSGSGSINISLNPPPNPEAGDLWYSPNHARTFIYYDESQVGYGSNAYWVDSSPFQIGVMDIDTENLNVTGLITGSEMVLSGVLTATSFYGDGSNLDGITESQIIDLGTYATVSYVDTQVAGIVSSAPATLDTLNELAAALNDDANFATTVTNQLALKADLSGDEFTGITTFTKVIFGSEMVLSGIATASEFDALSDINYKKNVKTVENGLDKIVSLRGVSYDWKQSDRPSYGVIAQELEEVLPELVHGGFGDDPKTVNYNGIIGVMIESIKELKQEVETLKKLINN